VADPWYSEKMDVPGLFMHGDDDQIVSIGASEELLAFLKA
jgi:hypothetical protein